MQIQESVIYGPDLYRNGNIFSPGRSHPISGHAQNHKCQHLIYPYPAFSRRDLLPEGPSPTGTGSEYALKSYYFNAFKALRQGAVRYTGRTVTVPQADPEVLSCEPLEAAVKATSGSLSVSVSKTKDRLRFLIAIPMLQDRFYMFDVKDLKSGLTDLLNFYCLPGTAGETRDCNENILNRPVKSPANPDYS